MADTQIVMDGPKQAVLEQLRKNEEAQQEAIRQQQVNRIPQDNPNNQLDKGS